MRGGRKTTCSKDKTEVWLIDQDSQFIHFIGYIFFYHILPRQHHFSAAAFCVIFHFSLNCRCSLFVQQDEINVKKRKSGSTVGSTWSHLILRMDRVSEALDMADTSLTSLSDDLKDRLSLICTERGQVSRDVTDFCRVMCKTKRCSPLTDPSSHLQRQKSKGQVSDVTESRGDVFKHI